MKKILAAVLGTMFLLSTLLFSYGLGSAFAASPADLLAKGKKVQGISYDFISKTKDITVRGKVWAQKNKVKTETTVSGQKMLTIIHGDTVYQCNLANKVAMKFSLKGKPGFGMQAPKQPSEFNDRFKGGSLKSVENTVYEGVKCKVMLAVDKNTNDQTRMWVREDYGLPMRVEITTSKGEKMVIEYKNMKVGPLPADTFNLPPGMKIQDMNEMMKYLPKGAGGS